MKWVMLAGDVCVAENITRLQWQGNRNGFVIHNFFALGTKKEHSVKMLY
jgi:hypothetical protein